MEGENTTALDQLKEYRLKKQLNDHNFPEDKKVTAMEQEEMEWKEYQEKYRNLLMEKEIKPIQQKIYDFTKGSENERLLKEKSYKFVVSERKTAPKYKKEDLKALRDSLLPKPQPVQPTKESSVNQPNINNDIQAPLLIRAGREEESGNFLWFRNVDRDASRLTWVLLGLTAVIAFLFLISDF